MFDLGDDLDPNAGVRLEIERLLQYRRRLWDQSKPWVNSILHGCRAVEEQSSVQVELRKLRHELLALGHRDDYCQPDDV
jgi:hypothetical protein